MHILIVEDEILLSLYLESMLTQSVSCHCEIVPSGLRAIEKVRNGGFDLVLMDILLAGDMDGIETARHIMGFSNARIIFVTSFEDSDVKERALALKPTGFLNKPVEYDDLKDLIEQTA